MAIFNSYVSLPEGKPWPYGGHVWVEEIALMGLFVAMDLD